MSQFVLRARWIMPIDAPPVEGGFVAVANGQIQSVGSKPPAAGRVEDLGDVALTPGLVNAHTHLEFGNLTEPLGKPGNRLPEWIRLVIAERKRSSGRATEGIMRGITECMRYGVTSVGDVATASATDYNACWAVASTDDARRVSPPSLTMFQEAIGFSQQRVQSVFDEVLQRADQATKAPSPPVRVGFCPHAPYTAHPRLVERIVDAAADQNRVVAMHLAESVEELQLLATGAGAFRELLNQRGMWDANALEVGARPLDYLRILAKAPRASVVHGNYLRRDEMEFLGAQRQSMCVVYCPRTHQYFGHGRYPLDEMFKANVRLAIGTDSRASNPDLNMMAELREAAWEHPGVDPAALWRMATLDAAFAIGQENEVGSLTPGKQANLAALPLVSRVDDPAEAALFGAEAPTDVWFAGNRLPVDPSN